VSYTDALPGVQCAGALHTIRLIACRTLQRLPDNL